MQTSSLHLDVESKSLTLFESTSHLGKAKTLSLPNTSFVTLTLFSPSAPQYLHASLFFRDTLLQVKVTPNTKMLEHLRDNPAAAWKLRVSFEVSNSGILHLSGTPKFIFDATPGDGTAASTATATSKMSSLSFDAAVMVNSSTEAIPKGIKEAVLKRVSAYERKMEAVKRRADVHNALETAVYAAESDGFPAYLGPYVKQEELAFISPKLLESKALLERNEEDLTIEEYEALLAALQGPENAARTRKLERECISKEMSAFTNKLTAHEKFLDDYAAQEATKDNASIKEGAEQARVKLESVKTQSKDWTESLNTLPLSADLPFSCDLLRKAASDLGSTERGLRTKLDIMIMINEQKKKAEAAKAAAEAENLKKQKELDSQPNILGEPVSGEPVAAEAGSTEKQEL